MIKNVSISFPRVIIVQDFEISFYVLFVFICYLLLNDSRLFILYISTAKSFSLIRGYIQVKINIHELLQALTQLTL